MSDRDEKKKMNYQKPPFWDAVFNPKSISIIGKTDKFKGGAMFINSLINFGYKGKISVVSTDNEGSHGFDSFDKIEGLPDGIDYAILAIPASKIPNAIRKLGEKGVRVAHIFSSGFGDLETEEGRALEEDLKMTGIECGIRIIGPNCLER